MDLTKTGRLIAELRHEKGLTQKALADKLGICAKTVSKWETGHGFPDISLVPRLSEIFRADISKLIDGEMPQRKIKAVNVKNTEFYVCDKCGNILTDMGNADIICCGRKLSPLTSKECDELHLLNIETIENDFYITFSHPMTKLHYISFIAYVRFDRVLMVKLYPEQGGEVRFPVMRGGKLYFYCNTHGLFEIKKL